MTDASAILTLGRKANRPAFRQRSLRPANSSAHHPKSPKNSQLARVYLRLERGMPLPVPGRNCKRPAPPLCNKRLATVVILGVGAVDGQELAKPRLHATTSACDPATLAKGGMGYCAGSPFISPTFKSTPTPSQVLPETVAVGLKPPRPKFQSSNLIRPS